MSSKSPYKAGAPPKYLNDFSKALAGEVRILLQEVGKLRDERRQLQQDISELMAIKARHGQDVEAWRKVAEPPPPEPEPAPAEPAPAIEAKPGWKTVHKKPERKPKAPKALPPPATAPAPPPPPDPTKNLPSWATWRPNPHLQPTPSKFVPPLPVPPTPRPPGLFGYGDP